MRSERDPRPAFGLVRRESSRPRVLLVGDARERLAAVETALRREPVHVLVATGARAALELLGPCEVAVAVIEMERPDDRYRAAELLRRTERTRAIPLLFVTAGPHDPRVAFRGHDAAAVAFLFRPVEPGVLAERLDALLASRRANSHEGIAGWGLEPRIRGVAGGPRR